MQTMDFALPGGWHVTLFHPWGLLTIALMLIVACGLRLRVLVVRQ